MVRCPFARTPRMKHQRLEHKVFIEALSDSGLVPRHLLDQVFEQAVQNHELVSEILVREDHLSDYELANIACQAFGLPFIHVFSYSPDPDASVGLDRKFLRAYGLVPLDLFGKTLTVAMPGMVPSAVLEVLLSDSVSQVLPIVGSVVANREWLEQTFPENGVATTKVQPPTPQAKMTRKMPSVDVPVSALPTEEASPEAAQAQMDEWAAIFDAGEDAVQVSLNVDDPRPADRPDSDPPAAAGSLSPDPDLL